jgi:hypothetical protein
MTPSARIKNRAFLGLFPPFISWCALWILWGGGGGGGETSRIRWFRRRFGPSGGVNRVGLAQFREFLGEFLGPPNPHVLVCFFLGNSTKCRGNEGSPLWFSCCGCQILISWTSSQVGLQLPNWCTFKKNHWFRVNMQCSGNEYMLYAGLILHHR